LGLRPGSVGRSPFGTFRNLLPLELNRKRAARLAGKVADYRRGHPDRPVVVVGYSGGGGMALFMAEALPKEILVDRIILLGARSRPTMTWPARWPIAVVGS